MRCGARCFFLKSPEDGPDLGSMTRLSHTTFHVYLLLDGGHYLGFSFLFGWRRQLLSLPMNVSGRDGKERIGVPLFSLSLRSLPPHLSRWERPLRRTGSVREAHLSSTRTRKKGAKTKHPGEGCDLAARKSWFVRISTRL